MIIRLDDNSLQSEKSITFSSKRKKMLVCEIQTATADKVQNIKTSFTVKMFFLPPIILLPGRPSISLATHQFPMKVAKISRYSF